MSDPAQLYIVKFEGGFDDIDVLNSDLRSCGSEFMDLLIEIGTESNIIDIDLFSDKNGSLGIVWQDEGYTDGDYNVVTYMYQRLDANMCDIIAKHLTEGSKLVISYLYDIEQIFYVFEKDKYSIFEVADLF